MGLGGIPAPAAPGLTEEQQSQRTTMELSLENPSKIITSSQPSTAGATTEPHPRCHIHMVFEQFQGWRLHRFPGLPLPVLYNPFSNKIFPKIWSKPPLAQLEGVSSDPVTCPSGMHAVLQAWGGEHRPEGAAFPAGHF